MPKCDSCHEERPSHMNLTINGVRHDWCESCWKKQRRNFMAALKAGDPKATRIFNLVSQAVLGKHDD